MTHSSCGRRTRCRRHGISSRAPSHVPDSYNRKPAALPQVMTAAMERGDDALRLRATDVLLAAGQHDPGPLRAFIEGPPPEGRRLFGALISTLREPNSNGLQEQVCLSCSSGTQAVDAVENKGR